MNIKTAVLTVALAALASCSQTAKPTPLSAVRPLTGGINTERHDVKMVCGRAHGESYGFKLLGIIPITTASESEAVDRMYENARSRGARLEGTRYFVNTSLEKSPNYFVLASRPVIRVAADLVEVQGNPPVATSPDEKTPMRVMKEEKGVTFSDIISAPFRLYGYIFDTIFG